MKWARLGSTPRLSSAHFIVSGSVALELLVPNAVISAGENPVTTEGGKGGDWQLATGGGCQGVRGGPKTGMLIMISE